MKTISILNHVLGPVMRGPSSSHTAGAWHIGCMARALLGSAPRRVRIAFDPSGSYAVTYREQGADRGFVAGLAGCPLTDDAFFTILEDAACSGLDVRFDVRPLSGATHPNTVAMMLVGSDGRKLELEARSIGGGEIEITCIDGRPVLFNGSAYESLIEFPALRREGVLEALRQSGVLLDEPTVEAKENRISVSVRCASSPRESLKALDDVLAWSSDPVYFVQRGAPLFASAAGMVAWTEQQRLTLGAAALEYESRLLGLSEDDVVGEILRRYDIMVAAVDRGLDPEFTGLKMVKPCAGRILESERAGDLSVCSPHTRAAVRAMAVMHVDGAMGVVCAAPTGGSAGVIPGTLVTLAEERSLPRERIASALLAAGAVGMIFATRATFAAEEAGCQVEIGAAGAMAAAAVVEACGGSASLACDAAAIALQNTMGSVCDLLHGTVEIPCHTRNAAAASSAFVNADLVMGGYVNPIPLDETIDAVMAVGRAMPTELRCTSRGGLALCPSAAKLEYPGSP